MILVIFSHASDDEEREQLAKELSKDWNSGKDFTFWFLCTATCIIEVLNVNE